MEEATHVTLGVAGIATTVSCWCAPPSRSSAIVKPRSSTPARHASETRSSSAIVSSGTSASVSIAEGVPRLLDPGHRLAHLADRAALEREPCSLDDRLVAEVEAAEAERLERRRGSLAHRHRAEPQAAHLGEGGGLVEERGHGSTRPDGIAGTEHHPTFDAIPEERCTVVGEEVLLVAAELEECERVVAMPTNELLRRPGGTSGSGSARGAATGRNTSQAAEASATSPRRPSASGRCPPSSPRRSRPGCHASRLERLVEPVRQAGGAAIATAIDARKIVVTAIAGTRQAADRNRTGSPRTLNAPRPHQSSAAPAAEGLPPRHRDL